jgi:hypothetical protein
MVVTVDIDPRTEVTMRYRSATDSIGEGSATPEGAGKAEAASDNASGRKGAGAADSDRESKRQTLKARKLDPKELKPGLWVEVEYRQDAKEKQVARRVTIMRPVGGPDTSPDKEKPSGTSSSNPR